MSDETRRIILARRARFVAAALASVAATATAIGASTEACGGSTDSDIEQSPDGGNPRPCLTAPIDRDAEPKPCLSPQEPDAGDDGGRDGGRDGGGKDAGKDAEPQPCLIAPLDGG